MGKLFDLATNPTQYDLQDVSSWSTTVTGLEDLSRAWIWEYLEPFVKAWKGKCVLEIGSGTGWLLDLLIKNGVEMAIGIEPSIENIKTAKLLYPEVTIIQRGLETYKTDQKFDVVLAVMVLMHIADLEKAFQKIASLLRPQGEFIAVIPDYDYQRTPRFDYKINLEQLNADECVVMIERPVGNIADVIRKVTVYERTARRSGMELVEDINMIPTKASLQKEPKYERFKKTTINHLLRFIKKKNSKLLEYD